MSPGKCFFDIGEEPFAVIIEHKGSGDAIRAKGGNESRRLPMPWGTVV
jgi:hypothetical protein